MSASIFCHMVYNNSHSGDEEENTQLTKWLMIQMKKDLHNL